MSNFLSGNGVAAIITYAVAIFALVSAILTGAESFLTGIGKAVPGWMGTAVTFCGKAVAFINGNFKKPAA